jgi:hypothetical protein
MGNLSAQPENQPQKWLCRLGPWKMEFNPKGAGVYRELAEWAQEKTQHFAAWDEATEKHLASQIWFSLYGNGSIAPASNDLFGRIMRIDPLPLALKCVPLKLPRFYPVLDKQRWTDVEVSPMTEYEPGCAEECEHGDTPCYWSVFVRLEYGGRDCVADMPTERQAQDLAAVILSASNWFIPST